MSSTTSESSTESEFSSDEVSSEKEAAEKVAVKGPGLVEKQIEEYLKNFDAKIRLMKEELDEEKETEDTKESPDQEETIVVEEVKTTFLTPEETTFLQSFPNPIMWNVPGLQPPNEVLTQAAQKFASENSCSTFPNFATLNPKTSGQFYPWLFGAMPASYASSEGYQFPSTFTQQQSQEPYQDGNFTKDSSPPRLDATVEDPYYRGFASQQYNSSCMDSNVEEQFSIYSRKGIQEYEDKIISLTEKLEQVTQENETLKSELKDQRSSLESLGPRYKYLEENFEEFIHMKDEYLRLKNERRKELGLKETYNKFVQTWSTTVMCDNCIKTNEMLRNPQVKSLISIQDNETFCVSKSELFELEAKFRALKENISEREKDYENREEKAELIHLTALNVGYRTRITELEAKNRQILQWATAIQKIIAKIYSEKNASTLTTQEEKWIERILHKYANINEHYEGGKIKEEESCTAEEDFTRGSTASM